MRHDGSGGTHRPRRIAGRRIRNGPMMTARSDQQVLGLCPTSVPFRPEGRGAPRVYEWRLVDSSLLWLHASELEVEKWTRPVSRDQRQRYTKGAGYGDWLPPFRGIVKIVYVWSEHSPSPGHAESR